jgi:hypothetical protein
MIRRRSWLRPLLWVALSGVLAPGTRVAEGQASAVEVAITRPGEDETFYCSHASLFYVVPVTGRVASTDYDPAEIEVTLELVQGGELVGSQTGSPLDDGTFTFEVSASLIGIHEGELNREKECGVCHRAARLNLPVGPSVLRIVATDPAGNRAAAERHVKQDCSGTAAVPVRVVSADNPAEGLAQVPVVGSAWLYEWRARSARAVTGANGEGVLQVEALAEEPTTYLIEVIPTRVEGVLYEATEAVTVTLPPGAESTSLITLRVEAQRGEISGQLTGAGAGAGAGWEVYAISPSDGASFRTQAGADGAFSFSGLPLAEYVLAPDLAALAQDGFTALRGRVDFAGSTSVTISLPVARADTWLVEGTVTDQEGAPLPFAWLTAGEGAGTVTVAAGTGAYALDGLPAGRQTLVATAPGYFSQAQVVDPTGETAARADYRLVRRPQTALVPWGRGQIVMPPESDVTVDGQRIEVRSGWIWGEGGDSEPRTVSAAGIEVVLEGGRFALEVTRGQTGWLYLMEGQGTVSRQGGAEPRAVTGGEMVALREKAYPVSLAAEPAVVNVLHPLNEPPAEPVWQPSPAAVVRDRFALLGVMVAPAVLWIALVAVLALMGLGAAWTARRLTRH